MLPLGYSTYVGARDIPAMKVSVQTIGTRLEMIDSRTNQETGTGETDNPEASREDM